VDQINQPVRLDRWLNEFDYYSPQIAVGIEVIGSIQYLLLCMAGLRLAMEWL